jgi:hypothetical protein
MKRRVALARAWLHGLKLSHRIAKGRGGTGKIVYIVCFDCGERFYFEGESYTKITVQEKGEK